MTRNRLLGPAQLSRDPWAASRANVLGLRGLRRAVARDPSLALLLLEMGSVSRNVPGISLRSRGSGQWGSPRDSKHARRDPWCAPVSCAGQYGFFIWALHVPQSTLTMSWDSTFTNQIYWIHWNQKISYPKLNCSMFECQILNDEYNICQIHPNANSRILIQK